MTELQKFNQLSLNKELLNKSSNNHTRRTYVKSFLTPPLLKELFSKFSANYIAKNIFTPKGYESDAGTLIELCRKLGIKTQSVKESANNPLSRRAYSETCLQKYGTVNALSKDTSPYKKRNKNVLKKYGVKNVFQLKQVKEKSKETMMKKYGVTCVAHLPNYERNNGRRSKIQIKIENYLSKNDIQFDAEVPNKFFKFNKTLNREYCPRPDIVLKDKKIIIEIYGNLWHGNPKLYKASDIIPRWEGNIEAQEVWAKDAIRKKHLVSFGYKVVILWELDILKNFDKIKKTIDENCKN